MPTMKGHPKSPKETISADTAASVFKEAIAELSGMLKRFEKKQREIKKEIDRGSRRTDGKLV